MARTTTRTTTARATTRVIQTPWGRTVTCVAPGAADDETIALFALPTPGAPPRERRDLDADTLACLTTTDGLFGDFATCPQDLRAAHAVEVPAQRATVALLDAPPAQPSPRITAVEFEVDVPVHFFDTAREARTALRAGQMRDGDVYVIDGGAIGPCDLMPAGVVVASALVELGALPEGELWSRFHGGRYEPASRVAQGVREGW